MKRKFDIKQGDISNDYRKKNTKMAFEPTLEVSGS